MWIFLSEGSYELEAEREVFAEGCRFWEGEDMGSIGTKRVGGRVGRSRFGIGNGCCITGEGETSSF